MPDGHFTNVWMITRTAAWLEGLTMLLLLDTDIFAYRPPVSRNRGRLGGDIWSLHGHAAGQGHLRGPVDGSRNARQQRCPLLHVDHAGNFRKQVWPDYKSNRRKSRKPSATSRSGLGAGDLLDRIQADARGDDVMGIIATKPGNEGKVTSCPTTRTEDHTSAFTADVGRAARDH